MFNRNLHYHWAPENPRIIREGVIQVRFKVNVWCGILGNRLIGPVFFDNTMTQYVYFDFLNVRLLDYLEELPIEIRRDLYFQQDGAPPHNANINRAVLNNLFRRKWIGTRGPTKWPARSPDLSPLDFFLWGYFKDKVYSDNAPHNIEELKRRIRVACQQIDVEFLRRSIVLQRYSTM